MKIILVIYVFFAYPDLKLDTQKFYNRILEEAFDQYCFLGIEYELTRNIEQATLFIDPCVNFDSFTSHDEYGNEIIGLATSNIHLNPLLYGTPVIQLSSHINDKDISYILTHEIFHVICPTNYHSLDTLSLMYPVYNKYNKTLDRHDSLFLFNIFSHL